MVGLTGGKITNPEPNCLKSADPCVQRELTGYANFDRWLRSVCFQRPTREAYDLAESAWNQAIALEKERCAVVGGREAEKCNLPYGQRVADAIRSEA